MIRALSFRQAARGLCVTFLMACGREGAPTTPDTIRASSAPVQIAVTVPNPILLVGSTVQLSALPTDAAGRFVNKPIEWKTGETELASVSATGLVRGLRPGLATIRAVIGSVEGTVVIDVRASATVATLTSTTRLELPGGRATLTAPPWSVSESTTLTLGVVPAPQTQARLVAGTGIVFGPEGLTINGDGGTLTIRYDPTMVPAGLSQESLQLYRLVNGSWSVVAGSTTDTQTHVVSGRVRLAGTYAVLSTRVAYVAITGEIANGALIVGQTGQLNTVLSDEHANIIVGPRVEWRSSNPAHVAVSASGIGSAVGVGPATITASVDGAVDVTTVMAVPRVTPDWSGAPEWTTYQGNPRHDGYVPVTADAFVFRKLWEVSVSPIGLNPATVGDGRVYVTTIGSYSQQIIRAYDVTTGGLLWNRDFGNIHSANPPAFDNGTVFVQTGGHGDSYVWGLNAVTGTVRWRTAYENQWSRYAAPTIVGTTAYVAGGYYGGMYAFRTTDGARLWHSSLNQYDEFTPTVANGLVYAYTGSYSPKVSVVNNGTGAVSFEIPDAQFAWTGWSMGQAPVLGSTSNLMATNGGRLLSFSLTNRTIAYDVKSGLTGQVTVAQGVAYARSGNGVEARRESDGSLLWVWVAPEGLPAGTMIATKNLLFVSTDAHTYAVDLESHQHIWKYAAAGHLALSAQGTLFIAGRNGKLSAIALR